MAKTPRKAVPLDLAIGRGLGFIHQARIQLRTVDRVTERFQERYINSGEFAEYRADRQSVDDAEYERARRAPRLREEDGWRALNERHLALIVLAQVEKVAQRALGDSRPTYPGINPVDTMRNVEEHWEEEGQSLQALRMIDPGAKAGAFHWGGGSVWIGDVLIGDLYEWLDDVEQALRAHPDATDLPWPHRLVKFRVGRDL